MKFPSDTGTGLIFHNDEIKTGTWRKDNCGEYIVTFVNNINEYEVRDYDSYLDVYFHMSDDGATIYESMVVVSNDNIPENLPNNKKLREMLPELMKPVMGKYLNNKICMEDLNFAKNIFSHSTFLFSMFGKHGDIESVKLHIYKVFWHEA